MYNTLECFDDPNFPLVQKILHEKLIFLFHLRFHCRHLSCTKYTQKGVSPLFQESRGRGREMFPHQSPHSHFSEATYPPGCRTVFRCKVGNFCSSGGGAKNVICSTNVIVPHLVSQVHHSISTMLCKLYSFLASATQPRPISKCSLL